MKITFPHMGNIYIPIKMILEELNIDVVCPPKCSKKTLEIGTKCSPETICVPFKINMGNFIEGIEQGADTIFMLTGCGPCRFGVYGALQKEIINDMNYDVGFLTSDRFSSISGLKEFFDVLRNASDAGYLKMLNTMRKALKILEAVDAFHDLTNQIRPREVKRGTVDHIYARFEEEIQKVTGYKETKRLIDLYIKKLHAVEIDQHRDVIKIGIIGEIYTIIENFLNINLERKLGNMGVEVHRSTTATEFVKEQLEFIPFIQSERNMIFNKAANYLSEPVGGHGIHTIGNAIRYKEEGYDGIIHLLPFTCMPEIVARSILPTIEKEYDIPIMTLVLDEMTGEAGYATRLEAFVDMLQMRRDVKTNE